METDNLNRQLVPYLEVIINQTLEMVDIISDGENFEGEEVNKLLNQLEDEFGEYTSMLSPKIQGRILDIKYKLGGFDKIYDLQESPPNTQFLEEFTK